MATQTQLEYFGTFIVYMSTVSNVNITLAALFVSRKSRIYTVINIYAVARYNLFNFFSI